MAGKTTIESFRRALEQCETWPCEYVFKFIAPREQVEAVAAFFPGAELALRPSRTGKYESITVTLPMESGEHVIAVYEQVSSIPGIIML